MSDYDGGSASVRIRPNMSRFSTDLEAELKRIQATVEVAARVGDIDDAELKAFRAEQEARPIKVRVDADRSSMDRAIAELSKGFGQAFDGIKDIGIAMSPALIEPLIAAVGGLSTSVLQLSEAGLVLPGIFGAGAASIGTFMVGINGVKDAYDALDKAADGSSKHIEAANKAMANLAPNARDFLTEFMGIKHEFFDNNNVQSNLFDGLAASMRDLATKDMPIVKDGMGKIATGINTEIKALFDSLGSTQGQGILDRILGNTAEAQTRFAAAIDPLVRGLGTLTAAGTDTLPRIADAIADVSNRFATFIETADKDGSLKKWMDEGITAVGHMLGTVKNLGDAFVSIARSAGGDGLLGTIDKLTGRFADWLRTAEGQQKVKQFFDDAKNAAAEWLPILGQIPGMLHGLVEAGKEIGDVIVPPLQTISQLLGEHPGLITAAIAAFAGFKTVSGIAELITSLQTISTALGVTMPASAATGAAGVKAAIAGITAPAWLIALLGGGSVAASNAFNNWSDDHPEVQRRNSDGKLIPGREAGNGGPSSGYSGDIFGNQEAGPNASRQRRGLDPVDPTGGLLLPGGSRATGGYTDWPVSEGVPALLHGREFVQQASAVAKYGVPFMSALNAGRIDPRELPHFDGGGYIDQYGNPITAGMLPGPTGPQPAQQQGPGLMSAFGSFLSGIQGPLGNAVSLGSGLLGQVPGLGGAVNAASGAVSGSGIPSYNGFSNPIASIPGLFGLFGAMGGQNPGDDLMKWGSQTAEWLGNFTLNTGMKFATTLWQGALGLVGLDNSILSPNNPYTQDLMKGLGYFGDLSGDLAGKDSSGSSSSTPKAATAKQLREASERINDKDTAVAIAEARLSELKADAPQSQRLSAQTAVDKAKREAADARVDLASLQQGGGTVLDGSLAGLTAAGPRGGSGSERWRPTVMAALQQLGPRYGITNYQGWADALLGQIQFESGGNAGALNPHDSDGLPAIGLGQFKQGTFNAHNITGGSINDGVAQIYAMIDYVSSRYGQNSAGIPNGINQGHGYAAGGAARGRGGPHADLIPALLSHDEHVFTSEDVDLMGGQDAVYAFRAGLRAGGYASGGQVQLTPAQQAAWNNAMKTAVVPKPAPPPRPNFDPGPGVQHINPPSASPRQTAPSAPGRAPSAGAPATGGPAAAPPLEPAPDATPGYGQGSAGGGAQTNAPAPSSYDHNLPALSQGIQSGFAVAGNIAATAASLAASAAVAGGSFGAAAPLAPLAGSAAGSLAGGLFKQGGKIATDAANVLSSLGVGTVTLGDPTAPVYGTTAINAQPQPWTSPGGHGGGARSYSFTGYQPADVIRQMRVTEAQDAQGNFATL